MSLTTVSRTRIMEPRTFTNRRAEFRFDTDTVFLSNLKLCNFGGYGAGAANNTFLVGNMKYIKNIILMDGNVNLCQIRNFDKYASLMNLMDSNTNNRNRNKYLSKANIGFGNVGINTNNAPMRIGVSGTLQALPANADDSTSWLYLKNVLTMLQGVQYLSTSLFKNLRLVIEFNEFAGVSMNRPLLLCEEIINEELRQKVNSSLEAFEYLEIEHDLFVVDQVTGLANNAAGAIKQQTVNPSVKGFDNKHLMKLMMIKEPTDLNTVDADVGQYCSIGQYDEEVIVSVDGSPLYEKFYDRPNKSLAHSTDFNGVMNVFYGDINSNPVLGANNKAFNDQATKLVGLMDYKVFSIMSPIKNLQLKYQRSGLYDGGANQTFKYSQRLNCHLFGEVKKVFQPSGDGYVISYV